MKTKVLKFLILILTFAVTFKVGLMIDSKLKETSFADLTDITEKMTDYKYGEKYKLDLEATFGKDTDLEKELDMEKFCVSLIINKNGKGQLIVTGDKGLGNNNILKIFVRQKSLDVFETTGLEDNMSFKFSALFYEKTGLKDLLKEFSVTKEIKENKEYLVLKGAEKSFYLEKE